MNLDRRSILGLAAPGWARVNAARRALLPGSLALALLAGAQSGKVLAVGQGSLELSRWKGWDADLEAARALPELARVRRELAAGEPYDRARRSRVFRALDRDEWPELGLDDAQITARAAAAGAGDRNAEVAALRVLAALQRNELGDELFEAYRRASASDVHGDLAVLVRRAEIALGRAAERVQGSIEEYDLASREELESAPRWALLEHPSGERLAALTGHDVESCRALVHRAQEARAAGRVDEALVLCTHARSADVLAPEPGILEGEMRVERGEHSAALRALDAALRRDPGAARGWALRARALDGLGDVRGLLLSAERAFELDPADVESGARTVTALTQLGAHDEARVFRAALPDGSSVELGADRASESSAGDDLDLTLRPERAGPGAPLPDPAVRALRVPEDAPDLVAAIARLPAGARRIVVGPGRHVLPRRLERGFDLVGVGSASQVDGSPEDYEGVTIELAEGEVLRLADLVLAGTVHHRAGRVALRRVLVARDWWLGPWRPEGAEGEDLPAAEAWFDACTLWTRVTLQASSARARFDGCRFDPAFPLVRALEVQAGAAHLAGCLVQASDCGSAPVSIAGGGARATLVDSVLVGPRPFELHAPGVVPRDRRELVALEVGEGSTAELRAVVAVELTPPRGSGVRAVECRAVLAAAADAELPGWTFVGTLPAAHADAPPVRVPEDRPTLAEALAVATTGAVIELGPGTHAFEGPLTRDVELRGVDPYHVRLDASSLVVEGARVTLRALSLSASDGAAGETGAPRRLGRVESGILWLASHVRAGFEDGGSFAVEDGGLLVGGLEPIAEETRITAQVEGAGCAALHVGRARTLWIEAPAERSWFGPAHFADPDAWRPVRPVARALAPFAPGTSRVAGP